MGKEAMGKHQIAIQGCKGDGILKQGSKIKERIPGEFELEDQTW
jgi:hypothetical protein